MKTILPIFISLFFSFQLFSQQKNDSLVLFSDLKFHSEFEKESLNNFVKFKKDTFNLFLAIDEKMTHKVAKQYYNVYKKIYKKLEAKKIEKKKINRKIKVTYSTTHGFFLKKYNDLEYFAKIFQDGTYNCVTASMLFSLILDNLNIPYKVKASSSHVYLIANPGKKSVVIETTNPMFQNAVFNGDFKRQYVNYLKESKLISEDDLKNKSTEEIFEQKFNEVRDAEFINLPGFQYYNKAIEKVKLNEIEEAYILVQKAYFFYPDSQVRMLLNNILIAQLQTCKYNKVEDIDLLVQLSRFKHIDAEAVGGLMNNIIYDKLQYVGNDEFCDSLFDRFVKQSKDEAIIKEVGFSYNMQMSQQVEDKNKKEKYIENAIKYKRNHKIAISQFNYLLSNKLFYISNNNDLLDSISFYEKKYSYDFVKPILHEYKMKAYLRIAKENFEKKRITAGNKYLILFEKNCELPLNNSSLEHDIETTYRQAALYYHYRKSRTKKQEYLKRGLKYVPSSYLLKSLM